MGLRKLSRPCWVAACDGCGDQAAEGLDEMHFESERVAHQELEDEGWSVTVDDRLLCGRCGDGEADTWSLSRADDRLQAWVQANPGFDYTSAVRYA